MNQDEIKKEIDCKSACRAAILGFARDCEHVIVALEAQLAEAEKPELRHLDFGDNGHAKWIKLFDEIHWIELYKEDVSVLPDADFINNVKGNLQAIFDDLKALREPLKEFETEIDTQSHRTAEFRATNTDNLYIAIRGPGGMKNINVPLRETVLKLRCLTAGQEGSHE